MRPVLVVLIALALCGCQARATLAIGNLGANHTTDISPRRSGVNKWGGSCDEPKKGYWFDTPADGGVLKGNAGAKTARECMLKCNKSYYCFGYTLFVSGRSKTCTLFDSDADGWAVLYAGTPTSNGYIVYSARCT